MSGNHSGIMTRSAYCTNIKCGMVTSDSKASECFRCYAPLTDDINERGTYYLPEQLAEFKEWVEQQVR